MRETEIVPYVSLFRGINVGGHHKIRMDDLKKVHEDLGLRDVVSYIQSGNVVFKSNAIDIEEIRIQIKESVARTFGFSVEVMIRTAGELREIIAKNPFAGRPDKESKWIAVFFLAAHPSDAAQEDLLKSYTGPEEIFILGQEAHIYYPDGMGRSKLNNSLLEKKLKTAGTARNWNTVLQLQTLM
ncbi:MAG: DUF1697 domain-containing protein [Ktedonobacteraceae bacterium]|nr:DUF1697 domain-containing protein [Ktedonobacteraceae bacterium]